MKQKVIEKVESLKDMEFNLADTIQIMRFQDYIREQSKNEIEEQLMKKYLYQN